MSKLVKLLKNQKITQDKLKEMPNIERDMLLGEAMQIISNSGFDLSAEESYLSLMPKLGALLKESEQVGLNDLIKSQIKAFWLEFDEYIINKAYEIKISQGTC